jgi:predicted nuclease with TOPRIM domain
MSDMRERGELMLELLRAIRTDISEIRTDIAEMRHRLGLLEIGYATAQQRLDRLVGDVEQIKRQLDLPPADIELALDRSISALCKLMRIRQAADSRITERVQP